MQSPPQSHLLFHFITEVSGFSSKKNNKSIYRGKGGRPFIATNSKYKALDDILVLHLRRRAAELHLVKTISHPVRCVFHFFSPSWVTKRGTINRRAGDLSNLFLGPEDALQKAGIIDDDSQILSYDGSRKILSQDTKIEIYLFKIDPREYLSPVNTGV